LLVVPALLDVAEETHDFVLDVSVLEAYVRKILRRHVAVIRDASVTVVILQGGVGAVWGARAGGAGSLVAGARWVGGPIVGVTCPPIAHGVLVVARAWARGKVGWVGVIGRSPAGMMGAPVVGWPIVVDGGCPKRVFG
jgi:hypothetical protein